MTHEQLQAIVKDPKTFLSRGYKIKERIIAKQERIAFWQQFKGAVTMKIESNGGANTGGYKQSLLENAVCNIIDLEAEIELEIQSLIMVEREIGQAINELITNSAQKTLLEMRYLNHLKLEEIAVRLCYAFRWVQRLHSYALSAMRDAART